MIITKHGHQKVDSADSSCHAYSVILSDEGHMICDPSNRDIRRRRAGRMKKTVFGGIALALSGSLLVACGSSDSDTSTETATVKVVIAEPLSGRFANFAPSAHGGQMAMDEINEAGGFEVDGVTYTFDYSVEDLQSDATTASQIAQQAIVSDGAKIVFGPTLSALADPVASIVQRAGNVLMMAPATSLDKYQGEGLPIFRTLVPDSITAEQYAKTLRREFPDITNVSVIMADDAVGQSIVDLYPPEFEANGFDIVSEGMFPPTETNFAPVLQRSPSNTEAYFVGYTDPVGVAVAEAAFEANRPGIFFNRGSACQPGVDLEDRIDAYTCIIYAEEANHPSNDEAEDFFKRYEEKFNVTRDSNTSQALYYYDHVFLLVEAMKEAGTVDDVEKIADALRGSSYDGVLNVSFNEEGVTTTPIKVGIVQEGEMRVVSAE